jgi:hypothetical protein
VKHANVIVLPAGSEFKAECNADTLHEALIAKQEPSVGGQCDMAAEARATKR